MVHFVIVLLFSLITSPNYTQYEDIYQKLEGIWKSPSSNTELDVFFDILPSGDFSLSVIPAFEYSNLSATQQSNIIQKNVTSEGYFCILETSGNTEKYPVNAYVEILLNEEISSNWISITKKTIYLIDTNQQTNIFIEKDDLTPKP